MVAKRIQANYDCLQEALKVFMRHADMTVALTVQVEGLVDQLQGGAWRGVGAAAFYTEMGDLILPAMRKLEDALQFAGEGTGKIHHILREAEEEAARLFMGDANPPYEKVTTGAGVKFSGSSPSAKHLVSDIPRQSPQQDGGDALRQRLSEMLAGWDGQNDNFMTPGRERIVDQAIGALSDTEVQMIIDKLNEADAAYQRHDGSYESFDLDGNGVVDIDDIWLGALGRTSREFPIETSPFGQDNMTAFPQDDRSATDFERGITWRVENDYTNRLNLTGADNAGIGYGVGLLDNILAYAGFPRFRGAIEDWATQQGRFDFPADADTNAAALGELYESGSLHVGDRSLLLSNNPMGITDTGSFDYSTVRTGDVLFLMTTPPDNVRYDDYTNAAFVVGYDIITGEPIVGIRAGDSNNFEYMTLSTLIASSEIPITAIDIGSIDDPVVNSWQSGPNDFPQ
ncbi:hypothetical protein ANRL4_04462 [Anaerolineae bacterium]|nr:hypothetical protein ANRL4_04462 [Anaerolineae bacterium]